MDASRFDSAAKLLTRRRLTRRQALAEGGAGVAAAGLAAAGLASATAAQDATPEPAAPDAKQGPTMLFVQSFQSGTIAAKEEAEGRYTVTLEQGLGQTIYFSDRPDRIVGATPTPQFLAGLGFPADNPPNAALLVEEAGGETTFAVVELFAPAYDEASHTATYEVAVLENWEDSTELGFSEAPADLAALAPSFGAAHLFIDDCPDYPINCVANSEDDIRYTYPLEVYGGFCYSWGAAQCLPCQPWFSGIGGDIVALDHWTNQCNKDVAKCYGQCVACLGWCEWSGWSH